MEYVVTEGELDDVCEIVYTRDLFQRDGNSSIMSTTNHTPALLQGLKWFSYI